MAKAVIGGVLQHVSPSQITTWSRCKRKWWFEKVAGLTQPSTGSQALGTHIHSQMEDYVLEGKQPEHPGAVMALDFIPKNVPGTEVEAELVNPLLTAAGIPMKGFIDLLVPMDNFIGIYDYKTTSDLKYAKTPEELAQNVQMMVYAKWADMRFKARGYQLNHIYIRTKGAPKVLPVSVTVFPDEVTEYFAGVETATEGMKQTACASSSDQVEPNLAACSDFGGCPYLSTCLPTAALRRAALFAKGQPPMALADKLKQTPPSTGVVPPDATVPPAVKALTANTTPEPLQGTLTGFTLYIDCVPENLDGPVSSLERYTYALADQVAAENGKSDIRLIDYGKGKGLLAAAARANPPFGYVVGRSGDLTSTVVEALAPMADVVVRGV